jgi:Domain of unknown function (DUF4352)
VSDDDNPNWWLGPDGRWHPPAAPRQPVQEAAQSPVPPELPNSETESRNRQNRRTLWITLGSVAAVLIIVGTIVGATHSTPSSSAPAGHLGQVVRDGDLAFKIYTVTCGATQIGSGDFGTTAPPGSQFCIANIGVVNTTTGPQLFSASDQYAIDTSGQRLSADTGAMLFMKTDKIDATLNPGVATAFSIPFELSKSARITSFVLHSATFSDGVVVKNER